ncbi:MAG: HEPN domain-containing protein [Syntrophomonadaceae bacterium]|jgi:HEPN domain-containing protein|nr:HEPN domain-containing protein [Syntrophomonadaceae bacterium]
MNAKNDDRGLFVIACANLKAASDNLREEDEIFVNFALFNISQAVEKLLKYLCACNCIDYKYSHYLAQITDKLLKKTVYVPQMVQDSLSEYASWATKGRYVVNQLALRSYAEKHIECVDNWIALLEKQMLLKNPYSRKKINEGGPQK